MTALAPNRFKAALAAPNVQLGLWQALGSPVTAEICATAGFDWLLFDGEHGLNTMPGLQAQIQAVAPYPVHAVARVPVGEAWVIKQYLDVGFQTLLIPFVESADQAKALVRAIKYGPEGIRGVAAGLTRAGRWGTIPDYLVNGEKELCLIVQIESVAGLEALDEILTVDGIDAVFIGPADLSAAYGHLGNTGHPEMAARIRDGLTRIAASGKAAGTLALTDLAFDTAVECGARFIAVGTDVGLLARGSADLRDRFSGSVPQAGAAKPAGY
jgi:4-hydroxy-2-oxoheptanedioate aldolase